jgi:hypothetical protein
MQQTKSAVESALLDSQRSALIRATKNQCPGDRLFVDFLLLITARIRFAAGARSAAFHAALRPAQTCSLTI